MGMPRFARCMGCLALIFLLAACSNGSGSLEQQAPPAASPAQGSFSIGGSVSGLTGRGLVLQNSGGSDLAIASDGSFTFATTVPTGAAYNVTVLTQPSSPVQRCTVANGSGSVATGNVTGVTVTCSTEPRFSVGGTVTGLLGTGLVLQNNAADDLAISSNGSFTFPTALANAASYSVTVRTQPTGQNCVVAEPAVGTIDNADLATITVTCVTNQFTVGGTVSGLRGSGLTLRLNGANNRTVSNDGSFAFATPLANGAAYKVDVITQPKNPSQTCTFTVPAAPTAAEEVNGTIAGANVENIVVTCVTNTYPIGGTVSGLARADTGLALQLNGANDLVIQSNGAYTFSPRLASGTSYDVRIRGGVQPTDPSQICTLENAVGTVRDARVSNVNLTCATQTFTVRGRVSGLLGSGLRLLLNNGNALEIPANATSFEFPTKVASGSEYSVTVAAGFSPRTPTQACSIDGGTGRIGNADVTNVAITCSTSNFTIGGTVQNLTGPLTLVNNNGDNLTVSASGPFTFATAIPSGSTYSVGVAQQPTGQSCTVEPTTGSGTVGGSNVTNIAVQCVTTGYTVGGTVTGLLGQGLVLQNNGVDDLAIAADGSFTFATPLPTASPYHVRASAFPPGQVCTIVNHEGVIGSANVQNVEVQCRIVFF
jgi:large repetitive protein